MILTVVPNPALDKTATIADFRLGQLFRVPNLLGLAGGKGFNVARSLRVLGAEAVAVAPLAGHIGAMVHDLAQAEGLQLDCIWFAGETRTCQSIINPETGTVTELYEAGPVLPQGTWEALVARIRSRLPATQALTFSGGVPRGTPADGLRQIVEQAQGAGVPVLLDTYGEQLLCALDAEPALLKCNQHEAGDVLGRPIHDPASALEAAVDLQRLGARDVVITLGRQGAVGVDRNGKSCAWQAPEVESVSAVGSGDAFLAAVAIELTRRQPLRQAVCYAVAVGAANTLHTGAGIFEHSAVEALVERVWPLRLKTGVAVR